VYDIVIQVETSLSTKKEICDMRYFIHLFIFTHLPPSHDLSSTDLAVITSWCGSLFCDRMASKKSPGPGHSSARSLRIEPTSMSVPTEKAAEAINGTMKINKKPITNTGEEVRPYKRSRLLG